MAKRSGMLKKKNLGPNCYGWCALADDYDAERVISDFLQYKGQLRTVSDIDREAAQSRTMLWQTWPMKSILQMKI